MRSPSGCALGVVRGVEPVASRTTSAWSSSAGPVVGLRPDRAGFEKVPDAADDPHAVTREASRDVGALGLGEVEDAPVGGREIHRGVGQAHAEIAAGRAVRHEAGGRDQRLARDAVGQHAGSAQPVPVDHRD
jgi:hypothetical protein